MKKIILLTLMFLVAACSNDDERAQLPQPVKLGDDEIGHYMQMIVADHAGPKAQLWLSDQSKPLWFVDVRDAILFMRTPEEPDNIQVIYAHDMAQNPDYNNVKDIWVNLDKATFVINSDRKGGMGMPEVIPFSSLESAQKFVKEFGGEVVQSLTEVPTQYLTDMPDMSDRDPSEFMKGHNHH